MSVAIYCRLCVEPKHSSKLIFVKPKTKKWKNINDKLSILSYSIDFTILPNTVCSTCYIALTRASKFMLKMKESQLILNQIFTNKPEERFHCAVKEEEIFEPIYGDINELLKTETYHSEQMKLEPKEESGCISDVESSNDATNADNVEDRIDHDSWDTYKWKCGNCGEMFASLVSLRSHCKELHEKCCGFVCTDCTEVNDDFRAFIKHVHQHRPYLRKYCHYCNGYFERSLKTHVQSHLTSKVSCNLCGEIFDNSLELTAHQKLYVSLDEINDSKPKKLYEKSNYEDLTCKICLKVFKARNAVRDHQKLHDTNRKREFTCDVCGKAFFTKNSLNCHLLTHSSTKPHVCKICLKSFISMAKLRSHVNIHSGTKPFTCEECGRSFRLKEQLKQHKIIHTDLMPYKCDVCEKTFRFRQILLNHQKQHTGAKPYSCAICGMVFTNWANFNKHMVRKHKTDLAKKKITPEGVFPINPETGKVVEPISLKDTDTEEWKSKIMVHLKRGKKPKIR